MDPDEARAVLGLDPAATPEAVRSAFRRLVRTAHPDVTGDDGATTRRLTDAYRTLLDEPATATTVTTTTSPTAGADTLVLALPPDEAFLTVLDAAAAIGAVTTADAESHLLEVLVTFDDGHTANALLSLQGRAATGSTDAFVTVDPADRTTLVVDALATAIDAQPREG